MKLFSILALFCAALVWTGPLAAHGDKQHGKPPAQLEAAGEDSGTVGAAGNTAAAETRSDEAAPSGDQASGADAANAGGRLEFLENLHPATVHFPIALFLMAVMVLVQGYLGGELAHGPGHLGITWL